MALVALGAFLICSRAGASPTVHLMLGLQWIKVNREVFATIKTLTEKSHLSEATVLSL